MGDLVAALGLALAIEGLLFAAFPDGMKKALADAAESPRDRIRWVGMVSAVLGVGIVWIVKRLT